eukprot:7855323-Pyramimonas_sp.AAC.1
MPAVSDASAPTSQRAWTLRDEGHGDGAGRQEASSQEAVPRLRGRLAGVCSAAVAGQEGLARLRRAREGVRRA